MIDKKTGLPTTLFEIVIVISLIAFSVLIVFTFTNALNIFDILATKENFEKLHLYIIIVPICLFLIVFLITLAYYHDYLICDDYKNVVITYVNFNTFIKIYTQTNKKRWFFGKESIFFYGGNLSFVEGRENWEIEYLITYTRKTNDKVVKIVFSYFGWIKFSFWKRFGRVWENNGLAIISNVIKRDIENGKLKRIENNNYDLYNSDF